MNDLRRAAELLDSLADALETENGPVPVTKTAEGYMPAILTPNVDEREAELEAVEFNKYLLAKSFFDCREFDRCTAVFLPDALLSSILAPKGEDARQTSQSKGKEPLQATISGSGSDDLPLLSQKSLFLALYAKFMSGEKRKDEDAEMVMGPRDLGSVANKQLPVISRYLKTWFAQQQNSSDDDRVDSSQGWLEYLYACPHILPLILLDLIIVTVTAWFLLKRKTPRRP